MELLLSVNMISLTDNGLIFSHCVIPVGGEITDTFLGVNSQEYNPAS